MYTEIDGNIWRSIYGGLVWYASANKKWWTGNGYGGQVLIPKNWHMECMGGS